MKYDAVIACGGPAGSTTACYLGMKGRKVLVLEKERFPRFHLGESLLPFNTDVLREIGVFDTMNERYIRKPGARFFHEETNTAFVYFFDTAIDPGRPHAWQVQRSDFDDMLLRRARALGAEVREEVEVRKVDFHAGGVTVETGAKDGITERLEAEVFVDATGRDTFLGTQFGLKSADDLVTTNVAAFSHWENTWREEGDNEGNISLILFDGGWWWVIPFKGNVTSVGVVFEKKYTMARKGQSPQELYEGAIASQKEISRILAGAKRVLPVDTTGNWSYRCKQYYGDRFLLVGDSAAFIDPLFSTGVLMAMYGARFAAESIDAACTASDFTAERFVDYQAKCSGGADMFKKLVHEFYGEQLRKLLVASANNSAMCAVITSMLAGDVYKRRIWHGLVKEGFSNLAQLDEVPGAGPRSTRDLTKASGRPVFE